MALYALAGQEARQLFSAAVHDYCAKPIFDSPCDFRCEALPRFGRIQQRAADLDKDLQRSPSVSSMPSMRFIF